MKYNNIEVSLIALRKSHKVVKLVQETLRCNLKGIKLASKTFLITDL